MAFVAGQGVGGLAMRLLLPCRLSHCSQHSHRLLWNSPNRSAMSQSESPLGRIHLRHYGCCRSRSLPPAMKRVVAVFDCTFTIDVDRCSRLRECQQLSNICLDKLMPLSTRHRARLQVCGCHHRATHVCTYNFIKPRPHSNRTTPKLSSALLSTTLHSSCSRSLTYSFKK